jgi:hypothetical protein
VKVVGPSYINYDPIVVDELNYSSEWMTGKEGACNEFVYNEEDGLTWAEVTFGTSLLIYKSIRGVNELKHIWMLG